MPASISTQQLIASVNRWWHSIPVAPGVVTPGHKTPEILAKELQHVPLHLVHGKSVLDIGAVAPLGAEYRSIITRGPTISARVQRRVRARTGKQNGQAKSASTWRVHFAAVRSNRLPKTS